MQNSGSNNFNNVSFKRRPNTGTRKNNLFSFGGIKKSMGIKNHHPTSFIDSEMSKMR